MKHQLHQFKRSHFGTALFCLIVIVAIIVTGTMNSALRAYAGEAGDTVEFLPEDVAVEGAIFEISTEQPSEDQMEDAHVDVHLEAGQNEDTDPREEIGQVEVPEDQRLADQLLEDPEAVQVALPDADPADISSELLSEQAPLFILVGTSDSSEELEPTYAQYHILGGESVLLADVLASLEMEQETYSPEQISQVYMDADPDEAAEEISADEMDADIIQLTFDVNEDGDADYSNAVITAATSLAGDAADSADSIGNADLTGKSQSVTVEFDNGDLAKILFVIAGKSAVENGGVIIRSVEGIYLPDEASADAAALEEEEASAATEAVEELEALEALLEARANDPATMSAQSARGPRKAMAAALAALDAQTTDSSEDSASQTAASPIGQNSQASSDMTNDIPKYKVFDISLNGVDETMYPEGFEVSVQLPEALVGRNFELYHIHDGQTQQIVDSLVLDGYAVDGEDGLKAVTGFRFVTDGFSEFVLRYTVDFSYSVNGEMYDFSLPGGEKIALSDLIEVLGIIRGTQFESVEAFLKEVDDVTFSDPELVRVVKVEEDTTLGLLSAVLGLDAQISADTTEEQTSASDDKEIKTGDWALISLKAFDAEESLTITMKNGDVITVKVTDAQIKTEYLSDSGDLFEVTVTYDEAANIPDGSTLKVTEFSEEDAEYEYARNSVLADKKARGEWVDLSSFGLAALDISILNPDGEEIEPEAPVQVDIRIKELPGVEDLSEVADTLAIQHHVEVEDGVVVETVFDGAVEASFELETNETVAAEGIVVDPDSVSEEDFTVPETTMSYSDEVVENDDIAVSFQTPVFSTFTVTWNSSQTTSNQLRVSQLSNGKYILYAKDAANNNYYALVPGTALNSVQVTLKDDIVQYSGSENLYWDVETSGSDDNQRIYFSFTQNGTKYYLAAGTTGNKVTTNRNRNGYGDANTTEWRQWDNCIHSAGGTFLQSYNGTFRTWNVARIYPFQDRSAVYFEKEGATGSDSHATIHYVDEDGNELTVSNGQPVNDTASTTYYYYGGGTAEYPYNYLIYDVDGYEYAYTYRNSNTDANRITPILTYRDNRWKYTSGTGTVGANNTWNNLSSNDDIYVVYKPKEKVPQGGTPVPKITGEKPAAPTITKNSVVNGDGTNTLSLSVTGHTSIMEAEKLADVIVVFDVSGSMNYRMDSETAASAGQRRMDYAQAATMALAKSLLGKNTTEHPDLIRMSLISFSNTAEKKQDFTTDLTTFNDAVGALPYPDGGTNWEYALQLANEMAVESDRATFVIFVTDGNPTFRQTRGVLNNGGTDALGDNDVTDYYFAYNVYGHGDSDDHGRNYTAALVQAQSIVSHGKNFYTIGISNDVTNLTKLTTEAGAGADHSKTATSNDELVAAFNDIAASIIAHLGYSDVKITDGITDLTQTVQKSALVNFAEDDFTYYKGHAATAEDVTNGLAAAVGNMVWEAWTPSSEGCAEAVYNTTTGAVEWNMGETFMLEDGYTYQVRFKVWPSQEAYDLLADLNNGVKSYASLSDEEKAQIKEPTTAGGMYTLKTNSDTSYTYREATKTGETVTPIGEPSEPGSFPDVDPLELTTRPLKVQKQWHNNYVDSRALTDSITMELYGVDSDGVTSRDFKTITLTNAGNWYSENNYISYGLVTYDTVTNADAKVYETGHDFTLRETDDEAHYYELTAGVYRPMFINGTPTILEKVDAAPAGMGSAFHYSDGSHHYYRLDGKIYRDTQSDILMIATNTHRSYMDLNKVVVDESGATAVDDTEFEYKITFTVPSGIANYDTVEKYIWFSVYDSVGRRTLSPDEYTYMNAQKPADIDGSTYGGSAYANYLVATSGNQFTLKIKQGWNVRFLNLPIGTTYSFEETSIPDGYDFVKAEVSGTRWIANMVNGADQGSAQTMSSLPSNNSADNSNTGISGTIDFANARYSTTYTNKTIPVPVKILKTSQDGRTPLKDAVFELYTESGYASEPKQAAKTGLTSNADGIIDLGKLVCGKYYLVETSAPAGYIPLSEPVVITVAASGVTYNQSDSNLSISGNGGQYDNTTGVYTLTVTNNAGYELPSTGGPGTTLFTILGSILIALAGAGVIVMRKRRRIV